MGHNVVFCLHGIGEYEKDSAQAKSNFEEGFRSAEKNYSYFESSASTNQFTIVPIVYDGVFNRILSHWSKLGEGLKANLPMRTGAVKTVADYLDDADKDKWVTKTGADVLLYWGFKLFRHRVILEVLEQMTKAIVELTPEGGRSPQFHVLAHSLGTAVAHDALQALGTGNWLEGAKKAATAASNDKDAAAGAAQMESLTANIDRLKRNSGESKANPFSPAAGFNIRTVTMVANVSSLIHNGITPYQSIVKPGGGAYSICDEYFNVNHVYDPIAHFAGFNMPAQWALSGSALDLKFDHLHNNKPKEVHYIQHYLAHPQIHARLLGRYAPGFVPTSGSEMEFCENYASLNSVKKKSAKIKADLRAVRSGSIDDIKEFLSTLKKLKGALS